MIGVALAIQFSTFCKNLHEPIQCMLANMSFFVPIAIGVVDVTLPWFLPKIVTAFVQLRHK